MQKTILISLAINDLQSIIIDCVNSCLKHHNFHTEKTETPERFLTVNEAADFLKLSVPTIYSKVSRGELPVLKRSKRLYFSYHELVEYLKQGRKKTIDEIQEIADCYIDNEKSVAL